MGSGECWERWKDGKYEGFDLQGYYAKGSTIYCQSHDASLFGDEIRAPKGFDGPCPEGCQWIDELKAGGKVRLLYDLQVQAVCPGMAANHDGEIATISNPGHTRCSPATECPSRSWVVSPPDGKWHCWPESHMTKEAP